MPGPVNFDALNILNDERQREPSGPADHPIALGDAVACERHRGTGNAFLKKGDAGAAEKCYGMALATATDIKQYALGHCNRAAARLVMKNYIGAEADADRAAKLDPENPKAFYRLGEACCMLQQWDRALDAYQEAALVVKTRDKLIEAGMEKALAGKRAAAEAARRPPPVVEVPEPELELADDESEVLDIADDDIIEHEEGADHTAPRLTAAQAEALIADPKEAEKLRLRGEAVRRTREEEQPQEDAESEDEVIDLPDSESEARPDSPEVLDLDDEEPISTTITKQVKRRIAETAELQRKKPTRRYQSDYSRFDAIDEDSDDETADKRARRLTLEQADRTARQQAEAIFDHFDADGDGKWSFREADVATRALEGAALGDDMYRARCEEWGADPRDGWAREHVLCMYLSTGQTRNDDNFALRKHLSIVRYLQEKESGVVIRDYDPGEHVEAKVLRSDAHGSKRVDRANEMEWFKGVVHGRNREAPDTYDVEFLTGFGLQKVPPSNMRPFSEAYRGPTGLRGDGKMIEASEVVDGRTGQTRDKHRGAAKGKDPKLKYSAASNDRFNDVGMDMEDDAVANRPKRPEDPVKRLEETARAAGVEDEDTGLLDRKKVGDMIGLRR
eukprot:TRINITY_DN25662_c0_g1_i1.p1 TRINITY_DN25662_c0_g1~~TRINITY_DN25662_c0_g1_i1.p1  ORF type:complete len:641 (+),score=219.94 TRINITY_DN25662_c0_g1_i1:68-1924(+)